MQISRFGTLVLAAGALIAGCSSTPVARAPAKLAVAPAVAPMPVPAPATSSAPKPVASSTVTTVSLLPHFDPKSLISTERSDYFNYGVKEGPMEAVSWGKERPKATGHDEAAWAENRRADLVYPKQ